MCGWRCRNSVPAPPISAIHMHLANPTGIGLLNCMSNYWQRRWEWAAKQSLQRVRWDSTEAVVVSLSIVIVPALLGWFFSGTPDYAVKAVLAVAATVLVLGALLTVNWLRAPAALDAERAIEIERLKAQLGAVSDQYPLARPYGLTKDAAGRMLNVLRNKGLAVRIARDNDALEADTLYRQAVTVFREARWQVEDYISIGVKTKADCGVSLISSTGVDETTIDVVREALKLGGLDFIEVQEDSEQTTPLVAFSRRDPFWVPPAKWG